jgi:phosphoadenosine phosphosulfate reductase
MSAIDLYNRPSPQHAAKVAHSVELLQRVGAQHSTLTQASSLGAEDMVVTHLIHLAGIDAGIFVLDTGKLHTETLALIAQIEQRYQRSVEVCRPKSEAAVKFVRQHGDEAMYQSVALRKQCCDLRKMEPLARALAGKDGWITGLRREQSNDRAEVAELVHDGERQKISPLVDWTWGDVWHFIATHQLPYNALHDRFFPSIGCAPCTRAIAVGEDFRAGRWWWESASIKECGLHVKSTSALPSASNRTPANAP